jgi:branched-chain amino acid transport system substrate-binding protein
VAAWVAYTNATKGGILCHPIRYVIKDDGADPNRNQALTQELIERDHAIALVGVNAVVSGRASVKYVTDKRIPAIGNDSGSAWFYESPMYFPQASSGVFVLEAAFAAAGEAGRAKGFHKVATLSCLEASLCSDMYALGPSYSEKYGMTLVYRGQGSLVQPDYTSHCQGAKSAGAQILMLGLDANSTARVARSCKSVGYQPIFAMPASASNQSMAENPLLDGVVVGQTVMPWMVTSNPAIVEYREALKKYASGLRPDSATIIGWVAAELFERAARNLSDPPTSESLLEGLWSIGNDDLGGLTQPVKFVKGENAPKVFCWWAVHLRDDQFVSPDDGRRRCD